MCDKIRLKYEEILNKFENNPTYVEYLDIEFIFEDEMNFRYDIRERLNEDICDEDLRSIYNDLNKRFEEIFKKVKDIMSTKERINRFDRNGYQVLMNVSSVTIIDPNGEGERFDTLEDAYKYYFELY